MHTCRETTNLKLNHENTQALHVDTFSFLKMHTQWLALYLCLQEVTIRAWLCTCANTPPTQNLPVEPSLASRSPVRAEAHIQIYTTQPTRPKQVARQGTSTYMYTHRYTHTHANPAYKTQTGRRSGHKHIHVHTQIHTHLQTLPTRPKRSPVRAQAHTCTHRYTHTCKPCLQDPNRSPVRAQAHNTRKTQIYTCKPSL